MDDLIVEDGTGLTDADAYIPIEFADQYFLNRGNAAWAAATDDQKQAAIREATQYIDSTYRFRGFIVNYGLSETPEQALSFPRWGLTLNGRSQNEIWPVTRLAQATAEAAVRALSGTLIVDTDDQREDSVTIGPISVKYANSVQAGQPRFQVIDALLGPFVKNRISGGGSARLQRGA